MLSDTESTFSNVDRYTTSVEDDLIELEQVILGLVLGDSNPAGFIDQMQSEASHFHSPYDRVAQTVIDMHALGRSISPSTVALRMAKDEGLQQAGGRDHLIGLVHAAPALIPSDVKSFSTYLRRFREGRTLAAVNRNIRDMLRRIVENDLDPIDAFRSIQRELIDLESLHADGTQLTRASELAGIEPPQRKDFVDDLIPARNVTILSGDGATGKTLVALQLAVATSTNGTWIGRSVDTRGPVIIMTAEDDRDELHRRLHTICAAQGLDLSKLSDLHILPMAGKDALLATARGNENLEPTQLFRTLQSHVRRVKPVLLILDPLADLFGGNEIIRTQAQQFISLLRGIAIENDLAVLLLAHPSLTGLASGSGTSGSTAWSNSVRSRLYLEHVDRKDDPDARVLSLKKANYTRPGIEIRLRYDSGRFMPDVGRSPTIVAQQAKSERVFLAMLAAYNVEGRQVGSMPGRNYAPAVFAADKARCESLPARALADAMNALFQSNAVENVEYGSPSKRRKILRIKG